MQQKSDKISEFSERTKVLADRMGVKLSHLPSLIGVSASMFFAYRAGKCPISSKAWIKLEKAERELMEDLKYPFSGKDLCFFRLRSGLAASECAQILGLGVDEYSEIERGFRRVPADPNFWENLVSFLGQIHIENYQQSKGDTDLRLAKNSDTLNSEEEAAIACLRDGNEDVALDLAIRLLNEYRGNRLEVLNLFKSGSLVRNIGLARLGATLECLPNLP